MKKYRVIQWATGAVGSAALREVIRHPKLELVGLKVYYDHKVGRDAGDIVKMGRTGVIATKDVDAIVALDADCVIYCPMPWDVGEMCRLLESGKHVITPVPYIYPFIQDPDTTRQLEAACKKGKVNFHATGTNPGGITELFPLTFSGWCNRIDRITTTEVGDCRDYGSEGVVKYTMNLGVTPQEADNNPLRPILTQLWNQPIDMIAAGLGLEVVSYDEKYEYVLANQDIETAIGIVKKGMIALCRVLHIGKTKEGTEIVQEHIWLMDDLEQTRLQSKMTLPPIMGAWRIRIEGDVELCVDIRFPEKQAQAESTAQGLSTAGYHCVNAVPFVCEAKPPGIKTFLDLPIITGCMGTHTAHRQVQLKGRPGGKRVRGAKPGSARAK